jgi:hypothetical protein
MVEKEYSEYLRISPRVDKMTFKEHTRGLTAEYDKPLLEKYLPVTSGIINGDATIVRNHGMLIPEGIRDALMDTQFIGVFGRVLKSKELPDLVCLQYLYVWDYQAIPAHEGDYEPIFVFLDKRRKYVIYDLVHYCSRRLDFELPIGGNLGLRMIPGWHSFLPGLISEDSQDIDIEVHPLSDQHLQSWWSIPDEPARLKIVNRLKDPFLLEAPGHFVDSPDENEITMCCTFLEIEKALAEFDDSKVAVVVGIKRAFTKCVGLFALHKLSAFIQLLGEMNDIGILKAPITSSGLNLASIGNILKEGVISVTNVGLEFFSGVYSNITTDEED